MRVRVAREGLGEPGHLRVGVADRREHRDAAVLDLGLAHPLDVHDLGEADRVEARLLADVALEALRRREEGQRLRHLGVEDRGGPRRRGRRHQAGDRRGQEAHRELHGSSDLCGNRARWAFVRFRRRSPMSCDFSRSRPRRAIQPTRSSRRVRDMRAEPRTSRSAPPRPHLLPPAACGILAQTRPRRRLFEQPLRVPLLTNMGVADDA